MARMDFRYGQILWVDVHPGDLIPTADGLSYFTVTEDMINPGGVLKHSSLFVSNSLNTIPKEK